MAATDNAIVLGGDARVFLQTGESPAEAYSYFGCMSIGGPEQSQGEPTPIYCPSSTQRNAWDIVDEAPTVQELGSTDFTQRMDRYLRDAWWSIRKRRCVMTIQIILGRCQSPDDFTKWDSKIILYKSRLTNFSLPELNALAGDNNEGLDLSGSLSFRDIIPVQRIKFSERGAAVVVAEVLDGIVYDAVNCGDCGPASDGCGKWYFLTLANAGSPGLSSQIVHSDDGGNVFTSLDIPTLGGLSGTRMAGMGDKLVVISQADGAHHYNAFEDVDDDTASTWARVATGYVAGKAPRAIYVRNSTQAFVAGAGGYIYLLSDPTTAVSVVSDGSVSTQDLNDVDGYGQTVVAVGDSNAVLHSENGGESFSLVVGPEVGIGLNAVDVISNNVWFVGTANGNLYYTVDSGDSWTEIIIPADITVINDIRFVNEVIGYMAVQAGGSARVYRSTDNGRTWHNTAPHLSSLPTSERINVVVPCDYNRVAAGGRKTSGGDGLIAIAE